MDHSDFLFLRVAFNEEVENRLIERVPEIAELLLGGFGEEVSRRAQKYICSTSPVTLWAWDGRIVMSASLNVVSGTYVVLYTDLPDDAETRKSLMLPEVP